MKIKTTITFSPKWLILFIATLCIIHSSYAQLVAPFTPRYSTTEKGRIIMIGNTLMKGNNAGANTSNPPTPGNGIYIDNGNTMTYLDQDGAAFPTVCSSLDTLVLLPCSDVLFAGLYWGGNAAANAANRDKFKLRGPADAGYTQFTASFFANGNFGGNPGYHAFADVTSFVQSKGAGRYAGADAVLTNNATGVCGGWTLIVVYRNQSLSMRNLTVFDGLANISTTFTPLDFSISGFLTPPAPSSIAMELGAVVYDGDRGLVGDSLLFKGGSKTAFVAISDGINPVNDVFNSTISYNAATRTTQTPFYPNTLGYDLDIFFPNNTTKSYLGNSETSATIRVTTGGESFGLGVITSSFDVYEPKITITKSVLDINGGTLAPGDLVEYTMIVTNNGNDPALNTVLSDTLAYNLVYEPGTIQITAGANAGTKTDASGDDVAEYNAAARAVVVRLGSGATSSAGGNFTNISPNNTTTIKFRVRVTTNCELLQCGSVAFNSASVRYTGLTSGDQLLHSSDPPGTDGNGCLNVGKTNYPISPISCAQAPDTTISSVCPTNYVTLSQYQRSGYTFYSDAALTTTISPTTRIYTSGTYYARKTLTPANPPCARVVTITVTINGPNAGPDLSICSIITSADLPDAGAGESWSVRAGNPWPATIGASNGIVANMLLDGKYYFVLRNPTTTCSDTVMIAKGNAGVDAGPDVSMCQGSSITLSNASLTGSSITGAWSIVSSTGTLSTSVSQLSSTSQTATPNTVTFTPLSTDYGTITLRLTTNTPTGGCGNATDDMVITVSQKPALNAGPDNVICQGSGAKTLDGAIIYNPSGLQASWSIVSGGGTLSSTALTTNPKAVTYTPPAGTGMVTLRLTSQASGGCAAVSDDRVITINPVPSTPTIGSNSPVCVGGTINLTSNSTAGSTYWWTGPNSFTSAAQNPSITNATTAMAGSYTLIASFGSCSSSSVSTTVVVNTLPAAPTAGSNSPVCTGTTINLTASTIAGATYAWTGPNSFTSSVQNPSITNATAAMAGTYNVTATVNGCTSTTSGSTTVVINTTPAPATASSNSPVCTGNTINLTASTVAGATYAWTGPNSFTSSLQNPSITNATAAMAGTYSVTTSANGCTSAAATTTVVVNTTPAAPTAGSNSPVCTGNTINLTASTVAGATYTWTGPNSFTSSLQNPSINNATAAMAGTYSVTATTNGCTGPAGTTTVAVNTKPTSPTASSNSPVCTGNTINLSASTVAGATYAWTGPNSFTSSLQNPSITNATAAMAGTYSVTASANGCTSTAATTTVVVNTTPAAPTAGSNSPVCTGNTINLTASTVAGATYAWTGPNSFTSSLQNPSITNAAAAMAGTYSVTATANGCTGPAGTTTVVINATPTAPTAGSNSPLCTGNTINLTASTVAGATYAWTGPNSFTSSLQNPSITNATAAMAGTYSVTATANGCTGPAGTTTVVINATPTAPTTGSNSPVCTGNTINLTASTVAGATYAWTGPNSFTSSLQNPSIINATAAMAGTYSVTATTNGCTSTAATTNVTVNPVPVIMGITPSCNGVAGNGVITVNASIANGTLTYSRDGSTFQASNVFNNVPNGSYTIIAREATTLCATTQSGVTVSCNRPPVTFNENSTINEDNVLTRTSTNGILSNGDNDPDGTTLTVTTTPVVNPTLGTVTVNANGSFTYTPNANANGTDKFVVSVCDNGTPMPSACTNDTVFITISPVNDPPVIFNETITINEDIPLSRNAANGILSNGDNDPDGTALTVNTTPVLNPSLGTVTVNADGSFIYTPNANANGTDKFIVSVCDNGTPLPAACTNDTVIINISPVNDPPITFNENRTTNQNVAIVATPSNGILANGDNDPDGTALTVNTTPVLNPTLGTVTVNSNGTYTYTPNLNVTGNDKFVVSVCDNGIPLPSACTNDTVFITINKVNQPPVIFNETFSINEDMPLSRTAVNGILSNGDNDPDGTTLTVNTTPVHTPTLGAVIVNTDGSFTYTPNANANGTDKFVVSVCDNGIPLPAACTNDTIVVTITPVNDPPVTAKNFVNTPYNTSVSVNPNSNNYDVDGSIVVSSETQVVAPVNGSISINLTTGFVTYVPNAGFSGTDQFVINLCDNGTPLPSACSNDTIVVTVAAPNSNTPPNTVNETITTNEDMPISRNAANGILSNGDKDPDGTTLTVTTTPVINPVKGTVTVNANGSFTYTPALNANGNDQFVVSVCDNGIPLPSACTNDTVFIVITPVNDPPVVVNNIVSTSFNTPVSVDPNSNNTDVDGSMDPTKVTLVTGPANGTVSIDPATGVVTYTSATGFTGTNTIVVNVCDNGTPLPAQCKNDTIQVTVNPAGINTPPNTVNETVTTNYNTTIIKTAANGILSNGDYDPDGTTLNVNTTPVLAPTKGTVTVSANGAYTYTPIVNASGADKFVVNVCDNGTPMSAACTHDSLYITILPGNTPPVIYNETVSTNENTTITKTAGNGILSNGDYDPDGTTLTVTTTPVLNPTLGTVTVSANGAYTYVPNTNASGSDLFVVSVCDNGTPLPALCKNDTVFVTITKTNIPPVIVNENTTTTEDTPIITTAATGILSNDNDPDGTTLTVSTTPVRNPSLGTLTVNTDGSYSYTPNANANGTDLFVVNVCDGGTPLPAQCKHDTVFITITPVNDAPVVVTNLVNATVNTPITVDPNSNNYDIDGSMDPAKVTLVTGPVNGTVSINATTGVVTYTPNTGFTGTNTIVVNVCDTGTPLPAQCKNDTISITVNPSGVNTPPNIVNERVSTNEDTPIVTTAATGILGNGDSDPDGTALTLNTTPVKFPQNGTVSINADGSYAYTPNANYNGTDLFVTQICDNGTPMPPACKYDTVFITINPVNDAPVTLPNRINVPFNTSVTLNPNDNNTDIDGSIDFASETVVLNAAHGTVNINSTTGYVTYTPTAGYSGTDKVVIRLCDTGTPLPAQCTTDTIYFTVIPQNINTPPNTINENATTLEDTPLTVNAASGILSNGDSDPDGTTLSVSTTPVVSPAHGTVVVLANGSYTYTPTANYNGSDFFVVSVCDNGTPLPAACRNDTVFITVSPVNDAPVILNDHITTTPGTAVSGTLATGDYDPDGTPLTYNPSPVNGPATGTILIHPDGTYTYTPDPGFTGVVLIVVQVCDSGLPMPGVCTNDTLAINVGNGSPVTAVNDTVSAITGTPVVINVLNNDIGTLDPTTVDVDPSTPGIQSTLIIPGKGTVSVDPNGVVTFTPESGFTGTVVISYTVNDVNGFTSNTGSIIINVNSDNNNVVIPQLLTPNNDGANEVFYIEGIEGKNAKLFVYNRWGNIVYSSNSYQNDWDGSVTSSQDQYEKTKIKAWGNTSKLPDGTYFYILEVESLDYKKAGYLELRR